MLDREQVVMTTDSSNPLNNIIVWDPTNGTTLTQFRGGISAPRTLCLINQHYVISAEKNRPVINVWDLGKRDQGHLHSICGGQVTALSTTPDGAYCIAGIEDKLHVWNLASGELVSVLSRHYQQIRVIRFTDDGSYFLSGGEDSMVVVWSFPSILLQERNPVGEVEPKGVWLPHSLPITDICIGAGGFLARVLTSSLDHTVKLFNLGTGQLLLSVIFDSPIHSVAMDQLMQYGFCGTQDGLIRLINFHQPPRTVEHQVTEEERQTMTLQGHTKEVTCLDVSLDGIQLLSGSADATVKLWHVPSRQCLRTIKHKGPITNAIFILPFDLMLHSGSKKALVKPPMSILSRGIEEKSKDKACVLLKGQMLQIFSVDRKNDEIGPTEEISEQISAGAGVGEMQEEIIQLRNVNRRIYDYVVETLLPKK